MTQYTVKSGSTQHRQNTRNAIAERRDFTTGGALIGRTGNPGRTGRLNPDELSAYHRDANEIDYVVLSYSTPIAWHTRAGWHYVDQKFSVTTGTHQSVVRMALHGMDLI